MVRLEPRLMEFDEAVSRQFVDTLGRSGTCEWVPVGMPRAIDQTGEDPQRHLDRCVFLALNPRALLLLLSLEIGVGKDRV